MAWTGQTFSVGQILTAAQMNNLQNDITALANGDSGAPAIQTAAYGTGTVDQAAIGANAVGQSEIKTTSGTVSFGAGSGGNITLSGGAYGFYPRVYANNTAAGGEIKIADPIAWTSARTNIFRQSGIWITYFQQYYFQASPPYDLGDGEVGRFIFALIDNTTSEVEMVYQASEAPWHYNGKTDIRGKFGKDGKKYRLRKDMSETPFTFKSVIGDETKMQEYIEAFNAAPITEELITQELCQRDMSDIPHPFLDNGLTGKTVVMLDPVSDLNHKLSEMCEEHDEFNLNTLLHDGYITIDNTDIGRAGPSGILIPSFKWKNTI